MQIRIVFFRQGMPEDSHRKSGTTFFLLLLYLSKQMCLLSLVLTCRQLLCCWCGTRCWHFWRAECSCLAHFSHQCQALRVLTPTSLTHRLSIKLTLKGRVNFIKLCILGRKGGRRGSYHPIVRSSF